MSISINLKSNISPNSAIYYRYGICLMSLERMYVFWFDWGIIEQVRDLGEASQSLGTLQLMIDRDVEANCVRKAGSHTRNLLRVKRGLDMVRVLFEQIIATEYVH